MRRWHAVWADYVFRVGDANASTVLVRSLDGGRSWQVVHSEFFTVPGPEGSAFDPYTNVFGVTNGAHAWFLGSCPACQYGEISMTRTTDGGTRFSRASVAFSRRALFLPEAATFVDPFHGWVLLTKHTVHPSRIRNMLLATDNGGSSWHVVTTSGPVASDALRVGEPEVPTGAMNGSAAALPEG